MTNNNKKCGVYKIINTITGDCYIGGSVDIRYRVYRHRYELLGNRHCNSRLQRSWNKYGEQSFKFVIVLLCDKENKIMFEQLALDSIKPTLNVAIDAACSGRGLPLSEETRRKLSMAFTGRMLSDETKHRISVAKMGHKCCESTKLAVAEANRCRVISEVTRSRLSKAHKGISFTEDHKRKLSESNKGKHSRKKQQKEIQP